MDGIRFDRPSWLRRAIDSLITRASNFLTLTIPTWYQGQPVPGRYDTRAFVSEAYEGNPLCYAAIMEIATSMAEAPLRVKSRVSDTAVSGANPLSMLLEKPNDFQSMPELMIETTCHMLASGNCYWALDDENYPTFMQTLPPFQDQVRPFFRNGALFYEFTNWSQKPEIFPASKIIHFKEAPDLTDPMLRGMSPIVAIRRFIQIHNILARYVDDFFHNNAVPPALLIFKNKMGAADQQRIRESLKEEHSTPGKYHSIGISYGEAKLERLGISIKDLDVEPVLAFVETAILQAFNIPPILVGAATAMKVSGWGSNYQEARKSFQAENLAPRQRIMEQVLNRSLAAKFGSRYQIYFDQSNVLALQQDRKERRTQATEAWNAGAMTLNEWRSEWGLDSIGNDGNERKVINIGGSQTAQVSDGKTVVKMNGEDSTPLGQEAITS